MDAVAGRADSASATRYLGLAEVHLQDVPTAAPAIGRIADWLAGEAVAPTR